MLPFLTNLIMKTMTTKNFTAILNEAYEVYVVHGTKGLQAYLEQYGISEADADTLKDDIIETYNL